MGICKWYTPVCPNTCHSPCEVCKHPELNKRNDYGPIYLDDGTVMVIDSVGNTAIRKQEDVKIEKPIKTSAPAPEQTAGHHSKFSLKLWSRFRIAAA